MNNPNTPFTQTPESATRGFIIRFKDHVAANDVLGRANSVMRRRKPARSTMPTVVHSQTFSKAIKGFAIPVVDDAYVESLRNDPDVESIEPDLEVQAFAQNIPWGVTRVGATALTSSATINGTGPFATTNVFVLDTGVAPNHPDLRRVSAMSFVPTEMSVDDMNGHGTAVAGVAAAVDNTAGIVGIAPGAPVHSYKCLDKNGSGQFSWIIAALDAVVAWKTANPTQPAVVNMSLGSYVGSFSYTALDYAVQSLTLKGVPVVVAAGNSGDVASLYSPAHTAEAITVGAYDSGNKVTTWSNYGSAVDILAPGANILTTGISSKTRKPTYVTYNGTSFSAPHVAGAVALYLARNPTATPADIAAALKTLGQQANNSGASPLVNSTFPDTTQVSLYVANA